MTLLRSHGRHAARRQPAPHTHRAPRSRRRERRDQVTPQDQATLAIFEAINRPEAALVRYLTGVAWQQTRSVNCAAIMAGYLRSLAGAR